MFTGIVETTGKVISTENKGSNKIFWIKSDISSELKVDQSISHNGVCLTIEAVNADTHKATAIAETLKKTNLIDCNEGSLINLERCILLNDRLDGHLVQGHVDTTAICQYVDEQNGSWYYRFQFLKQFASLVIEKGSICLNGISLTVFDVSDDMFSVAIIPYTYHHTNIQQIKMGDSVNIEFDIVGKYILRSMALRNTAFPAV